MLSLLYNWLSQEKNSMTNTYSFTNTGTNNNTITNTITNTNLTKGESKAGQRSARTRCQKAGTEFGGLQSYEYPPQRPPVVL
jgi:hypothetical protein